VDFEELLSSLDWNELTKKRIDRYEMLLRVTNQSVKRKKIIQHLKWLKEQQ
jgi:hypothetical protein